MDLTQTEYFQDDFLKKTFRPKLPCQLQEPRGINNEKLAKIKKELLPHMHGRN